MSYLKLMIILFEKSGDDVETDVPAVPTEEMEKEAMDLQNEEQNKMVEDQCQEDAAETLKK